jgi:hypothetical protein
MALCDRLKKTRGELLSNMGSGELTQWMAYIGLQDEEYRKKIEREVEHERQGGLSDDELCDELERMFMGLSNG